MKTGLAFLVGGVLTASALQAGETPSYAIVDTGQSACYDDRGKTSCPKPGSRFYGQDAQYAGNPPRYRDNGDGTIVDIVTGLIWEKNFRLLPWKNAAAEATASRTGGHDDWRVPTIRELYSLINFDGATGSGRPESTGAPSDARPYIDTRYFAFEYGREGRYIDAQYVTSTVYRGIVMGRDRAFFGVNFADGRIKAYPLDGGRGNRSWHARFVRGNPGYGKNDLRDMGDGTVIDRATGLAWTKDDSGKGLDWAQALAFCENLNLAGFDDWRLPDAKELHSIVDYDRSPSETNSAAIDPVFAISMIRDEAGNPDWPFFWTSTSHLDGRRPGDFGIYIAFGRAQGFFSPGGPPRGGMDGPPPPGGMGGPPPKRMNMGSGSAPLLDVHGAGAQRSSPKSGDESLLPRGHGPQGDVLRIYNHARCVRG